jgi:cell division transport system permease protein
MAINVEYVLRETGTNLKRNFTLTLAATLTVAVSLALFGASLLLRQGVENATLLWKGNVQVIVFLNPEVRADQTAAVKRALDADPDVKTTTFYDKAKAFKEFKQLNKDTPTMLEAVTQKDMPVSFRVSPERSDFQSVRDFQQRYEKKPGVFAVTSATDTIRTMQRLSGVLSFGIVIAAGVLLFAAVMLILNTIRTAMFARRREIEVMKLVGATNWFIRIPFMLEGLVQGLIGAGVAIGAVVALNRFFAQKLANAKGVELLQQFVVSSSDVLQTSILIGVIGVVVGAVGSALAVTRFLDV